MVQQRARRLPADKRKRQIIESARGVFASQSYARVGTADLAKAAGISEPALYRHFAGKKELFVATIRATGPRLLKIWEEISVDYEDPIETLWAIGVYYYDHLESHSANMKLQFRALSEADDPDIQAALRDNFEAFVEFVADTLDEGKARGIVRRDVDTRLIAWQFLGIGMTLDMMNMLGFKDEMDRRRADMWGRVYLETVRRKDGRRPQYVTAEGTPMRAPEGERLMDFHDTTAEAAFRTEVRAFIENECPAGIKRRGFRAAFGGGGWDDIRMSREEYFATNGGWVKKLAERGWIAPAWPKEYGGAGMTVMEQFIFSQEMSLAGAPRGGNFGIGTGWAGPTIILHGTEEQRKQYLPGIVQGDEVWCQGFSEPGAGSDLASVQTRAIKDGDDYIVNGQKIWTSGAHVAKFMILLARSDPDAPKHKGISYFIVDMKSPGITIQPLVNMANNHDFNEVFFDNVRVPAKNMIGEENRGWYVGTTTLDFERSGIATSISHSLMVQDLVTFVKENKGEGFISESKSVKNEIADRMIEAGVEEMLSYQVISMQNRGLVPNKESSIAKLFSSELDVRIAGTAMRVLGPYGQLQTGSEYAPASGRVESTYLYATTSTVGGGTSEIQRNIIASRGLGMPRA